MSRKRSDDLDWLMRWYSLQCDGDWEHQYGIRIETLDNPGWTVRINLAETVYEGVPFETVSYNLEAGDENADWWFCRLEEGSFRGTGGPHHLGAIIQVFRRWIEGQA